MGLDAQMDFVLKNWFSGTSIGLGFPPETLDTVLGSLWDAVYNVESCK